jgi:hypothetical protein
MAKRNSPPANPAEEAGLDHRERFVLRGGIEGIPESVPEEPEAAVDVEQALRRLDDPERKTRVRRPVGL